MTRDSCGKLFRSLVLVVMFASDVDEVVIGEVRMIACSVLRSADLLSW
jgi:hypothetical protein